MARHLHRTAGLRSALLFRLGSLRVASHWIREQEGEFFEARTVQRVENLVPCLPRRVNKVPRLGEPTLWLPLREWKAGRTVLDFGVRAASSSLCKQESEHLLGVGLSTESEKGAPRNLGPAPLSFLHPTRPRALLD